MGCVPIEEFFGNFAEKIFGALIQTAAIHIGCDKGRHFVESRVEG